MLGRSQSARDEKFSPLPVIESRDEGACRGPAPRAGRIRGCEPGRRAYARSASDSTSAVPPVSCRRDCGTVIRLPRLQAWWKRRDRRPVRCSNNRRPPPARDRLRWLIRCEASARPWTKPGRASFEWSDCRQIARSTPRRRDFRVPRSWALYRRPGAAGAAIHRHRTRWWC